MKLKSFRRIAALTFTTTITIAGTSFQSLASAVPTSAPGALIACESNQSKPDKKLKAKSRLKTMTREFWTLVETEMKKSPTALKKKGYVVGDFHFGNLGLYYDYRLGSTRLVLNDLDDSGVNYLMGDLLKFMVYLQTLDSDLRLDKVLEAYEKGLRKETLGSMPSSLQEATQFNSHDNRKNIENYLAKRMKEASDFKASSLSPSQIQTFKAIENLPFMNGTLKLGERWMAINNTGSSKGMERYLFLATNPKSETTGVLEFKELRCSATGPADQQNITQAYQNFRQFLRSHSGSTVDAQSPLESQQVVMIEGRAFLVRIKLPNLMNDLEIESSRTNRLQDFAEFFARYLGRLHSPSSDASYQAAVDSEKDWILQQIPKLKSAFKKSF